MSAGSIADDPAINSPAVYYFHALEIIDPGGDVLSIAQRQQAFTASKHFVKMRNESSEASQFVVSTFFAALQLISRDIARPFDLMVAASKTSEECIEYGLSAIEMKNDDVLRMLVERLPPEALDDEITWHARPEEARYSVVIEGPGFRDNRNRYYTRETAERAVRAFGQLMSGEDITLEEGAEGFLMFRMPHFREATNIFVEEILPD